VTTSIPTAPSQATPSGFIKHLHAFRGFAILTIVGAHCWAGLILLSGGPTASPQLKNMYTVTETLFHGSTLYFALISGLLYSLVLRPKGFSAFYKSKITNVIMPYALFSVVCTALFWSFYLQQTPPEELDTRFVVVAIKNIFLGKGFFHLWYIPVLVILFIFTPLLDMLLQHQRTRWLPIVISALPLFIARTEFPDLLSWQSALYFMGAYTLGMVLGEHYPRAQNWIANNLVMFAVIAVAATAVVFHQIYTEATPIGFFSIKQTAVYAQKLSIAALVLHYLAQREENTSQALSVLGTHAFSLYLLHGVFTAVMAGAVILGGNLEPTLLNIIIAGLLNFILSILFSLGISALIRRIAGKYSRRIIGA